MINLNKSIIIFILLNLVLSCNNKTTITFDDNKNVVEIPFEYSYDGNIITKCIINKDTLDFIFDTGFSRCFISKKIKGRKLSNSTTKITDVYHFSKSLNNYVIDNINWGEVKINNLHAVKDRLLFQNIGGILGRDIIQNMVIKIDNTNNKIILSKNPDKIEKKGIVRDFNKKTFKVKLTDEERLKNKYFLFDTGFHGDLSVDTIFQDNNATNWEKRKQGAFKQYYPEKYEITSYYIHKLQWDTIIYNNIFCEYGKSIKRNLIGTSFLRRFKSVTIDCINNKIYFEFPEDRNQMIFSNKTINDIATSPLQLIYSKFVSFGLNFHSKYPHTILGINLDKNYKDIKMEDTIVGIDDIIFEKYAYDKIPNKQKYHLETNKDKCSDKLSNIYYKKNNVTFHFLKNGKILSIKTKRDLTFNSIPKKAYCYNPKDKDSLPYFPIQIKLQQDIISNFIICFPYSTFTGKEVKITLFNKNGENKIISNKID